MTQGDARIAKNYIFANKKYMLKIEIFSLKTEVKKNFYKIRKLN